MSYFIVKYKGQIAYFSSIVDSFITKFSYDTSYDRKCKEKTILNAAFDISLNRNDKEILECLLESGLSKSECNKIIYDMQTKYYCPILNNNGKYECPNCQKEVKKGVKYCDNEDCNIKFVWRV